MMRLDEMKTERICDGVFIGLFLTWAVGPFTKDWWFYFVVWAILSFVCFVVDAYRETMASEK